MLVGIYWCSELALESHTARHANYLCCECTGLAIVLRANFPTNIVKNHVNLLVRQLYVSYS